jgi:hypothetical protein
MKWNDLDLLCREFKLNGVRNWFRVLIMLLLEFIGNWRKARGRVRVFIFFIIIRWLRFRRMIYSILLSLWAIRMIRKLEKYPISLFKTGKIWKKQ